MTRQLQEPASLLGGGGAPECGEFVADRQQQKRVKLFTTADYVREAAKLVAHVLFVLPSCI